MQAVTTSLQCAIKTGLKPAPPVDPEGGLRVLEAEQVDALPQATDERYRALVYLLAYRGPRIGEAAALRVRDLDLTRARMRNDKTLSEVRGQLFEGPPKTKAGSRTVSLPAFPGRDAR